jgi:hypothetical protein
MKDAKAQITGFKAMSTAALNKIQEEKFLIRDTSFQIPLNKAFVTIYKDKTGILFPGAGLGEGIFFEDLKYLEPMMKTGVYPVKGDGSFWEGEKERMRHLLDSMPYYCSKLSEMLKFNVEIKDDPKYLEDLSAAVNVKLKSKKINSDLYYFLSIYIGELLRIRENAEWKMLPVYSLNIYYFPELVKGNMLCWAINFIMRRFQLRYAPPIDIEELIQSANNFYPSNGRRYMEF